MFISYRRDGGESLAYLLYERLCKDGYSVFLDVESLRSGKFNTALYEKIQKCTDFLLILPPHGLDRCTDPEDWVRLEIECAIKNNKNIIPVMMRNFAFPLDLPKTIRELPNFNGLTANLEFFDAVLSRLEEKLFISKPRYEESEKGKFENKDSFDKELNRTFEKLFGDDAKVESHPKSPLEEKVDQIRARKYSLELERFNREYTEKSKDSAQDEAFSLLPRMFWTEKRNAEGVHFSIPEFPGYKTIMFRILRVPDYRDFKLNFLCEELSSTKGKNESASWTTFYYEDEVEENGAQILILHFNSETGEHIINSGILYQNEIKISRNPTFWKMGEIYATDSGILSDCAYNLMALSDTEREKLSNRHQCGQKRWTEEADLSGDVSIVIDPVTARPVKREVYFDDEKQKWRARIEVEQYKSYFAFQIKSESYLNSFDIACYFRDGAYNFPKDILKAITYFEEDGSADALFEIAEIFRTEESVSDEKEYFKYLKKAAEAGCERANVVLALQKYFKGEVDGAEECRAYVASADSEDATIGDFIQGYFLEQGYILEANAKQSFEKYFRAAKNNYYPAKVRLHIKDDEPIDTDKLYKNFQNSMAFKNGESQYCMGCILFFGIGIPAGKENGMKLLLEAAELGYQQAVCDLKKIYKFENKNESEKKQTRFNMI